MKIAFFSTMTALPWGGSEVLWAEAASQLIERGHDISINFKFWEQPSAKLIELQKQGAKLHLREKPLSLEEHRKKNWRRRLRLPQIPNPDQLWLSHEKPDLLIVTFGHHLDWHPMLAQIQQSGIPYLINLQVAEATCHLEDRKWSNLRSFYASAAKRFFLCEANKRIMEGLLLQKMQPYQIVDNPTKVEFDQAPIEFPDTGDFRLACIGRIQFASKGQDLLVDVLKQSKWKNRNLHITLYGEDQDNVEQLKARISAEGLEKHFSFAGYENDPRKIYEKHAGLILTSRFEGLPMVTVEAMRLGRIAIVTECGRNGELIDDGETGFLAQSATVSSVDDALEKAWEQRKQWKAMGIEAHKRIRDRYSQSPVEDFVQSILETAN